MFFSVENDVIFAELDTGKRVIKKADVPAAETQKAAKNTQRTRYSDDLIFKQLPTACICISDPNHW